MNTCTDCNELIRYCRCNAKYASENTFLRPGAAMSAALPPDEREALAAEVKRLARECTHRMATTANWHSLDAAIDRLARLAVQGGDAGQTDSLGASHFVGPGSAASRPEPLCVSALRAPIPGAEGE